MRLKGSRTEDSLRKAFAREVHVHAVYSYFSKAAREAGLNQIADMFLTTAKNEAEHAEHEFKFLGGLGNAAANLKLAIGREHEEASRLYPEAAQIAEEEGFNDIADFFRRMGKVEQRHEENFKNLMEALEQKKELRGKTVGHSAVEMAELMLPHHSNPAGMVHNIRFLSPVHVGDLVLIHAKLTFVGHTSIEVRVEIEAEDLGTGERRQAMMAHYIMVATDSKGKPVAVPPLIVITEDEERLFSEGLARYQAIKETSGK